MTDIEERAYEYACKNDKPSSFFCDLEKSYKVGATEQKRIDEENHTEEMRKLNEEWKENLAFRKAIDIDKACEWIMKNNINYTTMEGDAIPAYDVVQEFRKAMEEL